MAQQTINVGTVADDGTGDDLRAAFVKTDANFDELYAVLPAEVNATADQTGAEIKTAYEAEADTNAYTDAEKTKLTGIETSADVTDVTNVTAAGALMDSEVTNLAQVKAFDTTDYAAASHTHTASEVTDFDTEVSNNTSVAANTAKVTNASHTGEVTGSGALTIANNAVTLAKMADMATASFIGRNTAATGDPEVLSATTARSILNVADGATANSSDATLLARANHTGSQAASTISDLNTATVTFSNKTIDGDSNTISNLDIGNEVDWPVANDVGDRTAFASGDKLLIQEAGVGLRKIDYDDLPGVGGGLSNIVEDTTPQLGGMLDVNGQALGDGTLELLTFVEDALAVNHVEIENEAAGSGPIIRAAGDDANVPLNLNSKGTGVVNADGNRVLTTADEGTGNGLDADTLDAQEGTYYLARANHSGTQLLSTISDAGAAAAKGVTGADANAVTGTAGTANTLAQWNSDGDIVGAPQQLLFAAAFSDETTAITTGQKFATDVPNNCVLNRVYLSCTTAPTTSALVVDVEDEGTSLLNAALSMTAGTNNVETSSFAAAASSYTLTKGDLLTVDVDTADSGGTSAGAKIYFFGYLT